MPLIGGVLGAYNTPFQLNCHIGPFFSRKMSALRPKTRPWPPALWIFTFA